MTMPRHSRRPTRAADRLQLVASAPTPTSWRKAAALVPPFNPGEVWLVGAGPGAPELLTLAALQGLAQAQHIFHDALIGDDILGLAHPQAQCHYAGHRAGDGARRTDEIVQNMIQRARAGQKVMRLKGGDPYLFGRGAEEGALLFRAQIPFRVVPGITAGLGGLAYAGIPLTHRALTHAVTFVTGHHASHANGAEQPPPLNWPALAQSSPVLVIYMGLRRAGDIAQKLCAAGRKPSEPAAIILDASLPTQHCLTATLGGLGAIAQSLPCKAMGLIVIGPVVEARANLDWLAGFVPDGPTSGGKRSCNS